MTLFLKKLSFLSYPSLGTLNFCSGGEAEVAALWLAPQSFYAVEVIQWASCLRCHHPMTRRLNFARPSLDALTPVVLNVLRGTVVVRLGHIHYNLRSYYVLHYSEWALSGLHRGFHTHLVEVCTLVVHIIFSIFITVSLTLQCFIISLEFQ